MLGTSNDYFRLFEIPGKPFYNTPKLTTLYMEYAARTWNNACCLQDEKVSANINYMQLKLNEETKQNIFYDSSVL